MASLKRTLSPMKALGTTISVTSVMTGIVPLTQNALGAGGPVMLVFGFAFASLMASSIALSLADIASGFPNVKGGLIEYSRRLAPPKLRRLSSWVTSTASCAFSFALFGTAAIQLATGSNPGRWVTVFIHIIISILFGAVNALHLNVDIVSMIWHLVGPIVVFLTIAASVRSPPTANWILTHFENQTGWASSFYVILLGLMQGAFTMTGYDAPIHTMHSIEDAAWKVPQGILFGFLISFAIGELLILTLLYGIGNLQEILNPAISGISSIEIFVHLIGNFGVACMIVIFMGTFFFCGQGILKACSTIGHELAVSGAFPKSQYLSQAMTSAVAMELNLVYCIPVALRLFFPSPTRFQSGPFSLGRYSRPIALIAITWSVLCVFIFSLPGFYPITAQDMNYASILLVATISIIIGYWYFSARHWFDLEQPLESQWLKSKAETMIEHTLPRAITSEGSPQERDLDEIENWLDHLERDLRDLRELK
ncbi:hypothetical protein BGX27_006082 [Mortierella sp. AM989]|nr:hypothetical protein BGX27_006082 [Mortierella sp. AM989]